MILSEFQWPLAITCSSTGSCLSMFHASTNLFNPFDKDGQTCPAACIPGKMCIFAFHYILPDLQRKNCKTTIMMAYFIKGSAK